MSPARTDNGMSSNTTEYALGPPASRCDAQGAQRPSLRGTFLDELFNTSLILAEDWEGLSQEARKSCDAARIESRSSPSSCSTSC